MGLCWGGFCFGGKGGVGEIGRQSEQAVRFAAHQLNAACRCMLNQSGSMILMTRATILIGANPVRILAFTLERDTIVTREVGAFHPVISFMQMHIVEGTPDHLWKALI